MNTAEIIVIGDELLIGQVVDTNSGMIARELNKIGISIERTTAVHDNAQHITTALNEAFSRVDLVLTTGGLGPTKDDITKKTLCDYFDTYLIEDLQVKAHIEDLYAYRKQVLNELTATQWQVPKDCVVLENRVGSAPIMEFHKGSKLLYSMPGVPVEAEIAIKEQIVPQLLKYNADALIIHRTTIVYDIPESSLAILIADWEDALPEYMHLAYLPNYRMIRLRLTAMSSDIDRERIEREIDEQLAQLHSLIKKYIIATEDQPIEVLVGAALKSTNATVSSAESCTGGRIAALLNKHAGSSSFYYGSVVAYDNSIKQGVLGVNKQTLDNFGAVSEQTVNEMADGVRKMMNTTWAVATSGIAGPDGGTTEKPVGTVWMAVAGPKGTKAECHYFRGSREQITAHAAVAALIMLYKEIQEYNNLNIC